MNTFDCMEDCIHLKACRRLQAIGRKHRLMVPRYCTEDCTAYEPEKKLYTEEQVYRIIHGMEEYHGLPYGDDLISDFI